MNTSRALENYKRSLSYLGLNENLETYVFLGDTFEIKDSIKAAGGRFNKELGWHISNAPAGFEVMKFSFSKKDLEMDATTGYIYGLIIDSKEIDKIKSEEWAKRHPEEFTSEWVGEEKEKIFRELTCDSITNYYGASYGFYDSGFRYVYKFLDENGNRFICKTSKPIEYINDDEVNELQIGSVYGISFTIKAHDTYKGNKQTIITRCRVRYERS